MIEPRIKELIHAGIDGELDAAGKAELATAMHQSDEARRYMEQMQDLASFLESAPVIEPPAGLHRQITERIGLPSAGPVRSFFGMGRVPGYAGLGLAAALLLAIGIYEFRPGAQDPADLSNMTGTIMPAAAGRQVIDRHDFEAGRVSSAVALERRDGALFLVVQLDAGGPEEITIDIASHGLRFDSITQLSGDPDAAELADHAMRVTARGRQHFTVSLQRTPGQEPGRQAIIRLDVSSNGILLHTGELTGD